MVEFKGNIINQPVGVPIIATNSVVFHVGDPLSLVSGFLALATTSSKIFGYALEDYTAASDNQTVAKYCPQYCYADGVEILIDTDQAVLQTDIGGYACLGTVTTAAQVLNLAASATVGQFMVLGWDTQTPNTSKAICVAAYKAKDAYASS